MKVSEFKRMITKRGCRFVRHGGEHDIWVNPKTGQEGQVPRHNAQDLHTGTANRILKDLGLK